MTVLPTDHRVVILASIAGDPDADICVRCDGHAWIAIPDPLLGDWIDVPCPLCGPLRLIR